MDTDTPTDRSIDADPSPRYADVETNDGDLIVYDEDEEEAWIQSSTWTGLDDAR